MRRMAGEGLVAIANALGRSTTSIKMAAHRYRISLRGPGYRGGLVLGQPRNASWSQLRSNGHDARLFRALRQQLLAGEIDINELEREAVRTSRLARGAQLCPACTRNPQEVERTGLCLDCHMKELAKAHRNLEFVRGPRRELWQARQAKVRRHRRSEKRLPTDG